jgi:zinc transport system substrate-binding protein
MILMTARLTRWTATAVASAATLLVSGCGGADSGGGDDGVSVLAGFYPLEWVTARVGGDVVSVSSLTAPGAEPHDLELAPQDIAAVSEADLLVYLEGFQPALDEAAHSEAEDHAWDAGQAADLSLTAEEAHGDEAHADEAHADEHAESVDPHFWLDPLRLAQVGDALAEQLAEVDPGNADAYEENAAALRADLEELDGEMQNALSNCQVDTLVTGHDAFGYLGDRYGFEVVGISGLSPSAEPDPAGLAEIAELVEQRGVTTVYTETLVDPAIAETVASEAGAETAVLDPIEGLTDESAGEDYLEVMRANMATLQEGQACA